VNVAKSRRRAGFTLIELMVVLSIAALLMGLVMPALSAARNEGRRVKCLANLQAIGQACTAYATDDREMYLIPVHPRAEDSYVDGRRIVGYHFDGEYEYGGGPSTIPGFVGNLFRGVFGPTTRGLNRFLYGEVTPHSDFRLFQCPGDTGVVDAPRVFDTSLPVEIPMFNVTGTSYRVNNHIKMYTDRYFYGPYLRPMTRIPAAAETALIAETIAQVAIYNPPPFIAPGWHARPMRYNVVFADGHSDTIRIQGGHEPPREEYDGYWIFRGPGWRLDCYPDTPIYDLPKR
jgi:prepilin-type N-terminal cleavage/methylation domain-containing protein